MLEDRTPIATISPDEWAAPPDPEYWLEHFEGFRVDCAGCRIGFVEEVRSDDSTGDWTLAIRAGMLGRRLLLVPAGEVAFIVPRGLSDDCDIRWAADSVADVHVAQFCGVSAVRDLASPAVVPRRRNPVGRR